MAIRLRNIKGTWVAICAAKSRPEIGDVYLDDGMHHALTTKFGLDFHSEGFMENDLADEHLVKLMKMEETWSSSVAQPNPLYTIGRERL